MGLINCSNSRERLSRIFMAGFLTYSSFVRPSHLAMARQWMLSVAQGFLLSLQQRVCSGLTPDSLLIINLEV